MNPAFSRPAPERLHDFERAFGVKDITTLDMHEAILEWYRLYYAVKPTNGEDPCQRIPYTIVNKLTKTTFSEYVATQNKGADNRFLAGVLAGLDRAKKKAVQNGLIGGACWLKPSFHRDGSTSFSVIPRPNVAVFSRDDMDRVTSIGTTERTIESGYHYTLLERRTVTEDGLLTVENKLYQSKSAEVLGSEVPLGTLPKYAGLAPVYTFAMPLHSLGLIPVRAPMENCVDGSPDAVSVYAPATGLIHNINANEYQMNREFGHGKMRVVASADMMTVDKDGKKHFDDDIFVGLDDDPDTVGVTVFAPPFRDASYLARKREYLRNCESMIGLKRGLLSEVEAAERTAKEITSSEGDYNLTIIDFQEMWEAAAREAIRVCSVLGRLYRVYVGPEIDPEKDVSISWGNGILYDEDQVWVDLKAMVAAKLLKPEIAVGWYFDMPTETEADLAKVREKYMPEIELMAGDEDGL